MRRGAAGNFAQSGPDFALKGSAAGGDGDVVDGVEIAGEVAGHGFGDVVGILRAVEPVTVVAVVKTELTVDGLRVLSEERNAEVACLVDRESEGADGGGEMVSEESQRVAHGELMHPGDTPILAWLSGRTGRLEVAVVAEERAARVGGDVPGAEEENGDHGEGPEEELHRKCRDKRLVAQTGATGPGEEESAGEAGARGHAEAKEGDGEAFFKAAAGDEEGAQRSPAKGEKAEEEGDCAREVEEHEPILCERL